MLNEAIAVGGSHLTEQAVHMGAAVELISILSLRVFNMPTKDWTEKANESKALASPILRAGALSMAPSSLQLSWLSVLIL